MACRNLAPNSDGPQVLIELAARVGELTNKNRALICENRELTERNKNLQSQVMKLLEQNSNFNKKIETLTERLAESENSEEVVCQAKKQKKT